MIVAVIPYKGGETGKSRLSSVLTDAQRRVLGRHMLAHVLAVLDGIEDISSSAVVTKDQLDRPHVIPDPGLGLNPAIAVGADWAVEQGAQSMLVLPADLPFLRPSDIRALIDAQPACAGVVVAPSRDGGTGGLLLRPPEVIQAAFGLDSSRTHATSLAVTAGHTVVVHRSGLAIDIDSPEDLDLLGDELLDVVWNGNRHGSYGAVDRPDETGQYIAGSHLDKCGMAVTDEALH